MFDDMNLEFEDHGRGRRRRAERTEEYGRAEPPRAAGNPWPEQQPQRHWGGEPDHRGRDDRYPGHEDRYPGRDDRQPGRGDRHAGRDGRHPGGDAYQPWGYEERRERRPDYGYDTGQHGFFDEPQYDEPQGRRRRGSESDSRGPEKGRRGSEKGRKGSGRKRNGRPVKRRRNRSVLALVLVLLMLGGLGGVAYVGYDRVTGYFVTPDYSGSGDGEVVQIEVQRGQLLGDIANTLVRHDVVKSYKAFVKAAEANKDAQNIQPGFYAMHRRMSGAAAVLALLDPKTRQVKAVTITEGEITLDVYAKLSKALDIPLADFTAAAKDPVALGVPDWWFQRGDGKKPVVGLEGFLFPETYQFPPNATAESALKMMIDHFLTVTGEMGFAENVRKNLNISPYEALVAASIAQKEALDDADLSKVTRVLYNRAYSEDWPCQCLQIDSAVNYWLRISGKSGKDSNDLTYKELTDTRNPYRTHATPTAPARGLPVGPIGNPGEVALRGAMAPTAGKWTYFMTVDKKGTMGYASSDAEFEQLKAKACRNGVLYGDLC